MEIIKSYNERDCVSNVRGQFSDGGEITVLWDWPENEEYNLCIVFDLQDGSDDLEALLSKNATKTVYSNEFGICHKMTIPSVTANSWQFRVYPAKKKDGNLWIVDQKEGNQSEAFQRPVDLVYWIEYDKPKLFAHTRKARIIFQNLKNLEEGYLCYCVKGGSRGTLKYGIDIRHFRGKNRFEIVVEKKETIEVYLEEKQKKHIRLIQGEMR